MAKGGKAYPSRSSHGRLSASTAYARGAGTGGLLLNLAAKKPRDLSEAGDTDSLYAACFLKGTSLLLQSVPLSGCPTIL